MFVRWLARVFRRRYWASDSGERRDMAPVLSLMRISCSGTPSAALSGVPGLAGSELLGALVRGTTVMVVGRCPPREKVVRCRRR